MSPPNVLMGLTVTALLTACSGVSDVSDDDDDSIGATGLALYVLAGGTSVPDVTDLHLDGRLDPGEIFILPKVALLGTTAYEVDIRVTAGSVTFEETWSFTTAAVAATPGTATVIGEINSFRTQAGALPALTANAALDEAATLHSGYQCEEAELTHDEPNTAAQFFVHDNFDSRIFIANGSAPVIATPGYVVYEIIASTGGPDAVVTLWNTVYHRLPMMRRHVTLVGDGQRSDAFLLPENTPSAFVLAGTAHHTIDFAGDVATAQTLAFWPPDGQTGVSPSFSTNLETPDPIDSGNANGTPDAGIVGPPIHVILPTTSDITAITVTVKEL
jgi:hypothetical protein